MSLVSFVLGVAALGIPAQRVASVRIINAVADREQLAFSVDVGVWESVPYGQRTRYEDIPVPTTQVLASVMQRRGEKIANDVPVKLQPGYPHTIIFTGMVQNTGNFTPIVLRDTTAGRPTTNSVQMMFVNAMSDQIPVSITMNDATPQRRAKLEFGVPTPIIGYEAREYAVKLLDMDKKVLYETKLKAFGGTRYSVVAMGATAGQGNRSPRVFFYTF